MNVIFSFPSTRWQKDIWAWMPQNPQVYVKVRFKPACLATETSQTIEILFGARQDMILFNKQTDQRLCCLETPEGRFSRVEAHMWARKY